VCCFIICVAHVHYKIVYSVHSCVLVVLNLISIFTSLGSLVLFGACFSCYPSHLIFQLVVKYLMDIFVTRTLMAVHKHD